jgi:MFS superfamily sulfate permease-like transporter
MTPNVDGAGTPEASRSGRARGGYRGGILRRDLLAGLTVAVLALPSAPLGDLLALVPAALGIFFVSVSDEILIARAFAGRHGQHVRADTELAAMGAASLAARRPGLCPAGAGDRRPAPGHGRRSGPRLRG